MLFSILAINTLKPSPVTIRVGANELQMPLTTDEIRRVVESWPTTDDDLPPSVRLLFDSWNAERMNGINPAIRALRDDPAVAWHTPRSGVTKAAKCRALTAHGVLSPGGVPAPTEADLRSMLPDEGGGRRYNSPSSFGEAARCSTSDVAGGA